MNEKGLKVLEYSKIIDLLKAQAGSPMAKEQIAALTPTDDIYQIREWLMETSEAVSLIIAKGSLPIGQLYDIDYSLHIAKKGGVLTMGALLHLLYNLKITVNVINHMKGDVPDIPGIKGMVSLLVPYHDLIERIDRSIISDEEMADAASSELRSIRRAIGRQNEAIRAKLNSILASGENKTLLQDSIVTMRGGRYVVPVKAEHRGRMQGIVHDQSSSGATLFIEPQVIVNLNNELRELELAEKAEIERILADITGDVASGFDDLLNNQKLLVALDVIFAKGKLSCTMKAEEPELNEDGILELREARHPLIDAKKVVPINVAIGEAYKTLVVTGPNTGGKTVTLKTVGLLAQMVQSGLHIPAASTSKMPVFKDIFADIGDEQSIEQSLSTFSSHMKNTVELVEKAWDGTLVLLDELGAGTDPTEGAALAISILERLARQGAVTIATTHYNELKKYAIATEGVENASMEFSVETLSPTYRLSIGVPGKSNAFEISKKLGLPHDIIQRAGQLLERGDIEFEDVLSAIEADKKRVEAERDEAVALRRQIETELAEQKRLTGLAQKREKEALDAAKEEAKAIIREARETAEEVQRELRELNKVESLGERNKALEQNKYKLRQKELEYDGEGEVIINENPIDLDKLAVGDRVKVLTLGQNGEIISLLDQKGEVTVKLGNMKMSVKPSDLMAINDGTKKKKSSGNKYGGMFRAKAMSISTSINVQGENLEEAMLDVDKYLDDAYMAGLKEVTVIHGRGTGVLKEGLRQVFRRHKHVDKFRKGAYSEGGDGVTVVTLKS